MGTAMKTEHQQWLMELTALSTAAGREDRVVEWIKHWASGIPNIELKADRFGNLVIKRRGISSKLPLFITAHMDHPSFVVTEVIDPKTVRAEFRGGVNDSYFVGSGVVLDLLGAAP